MASVRRVEYEHYKLQRSIDHRCDRTDIRVTLVANRVFVRKIQENLWQWREIDATDHWVTEEFYTGDSNLLKESVEGKLVALVVPGINVVSQVLPADLSDRRQLIKTLPYELEEDIIDSVDDLHFAFGPIENGTISTAYGDAEYLQSSIDEVVALGADVQSCSADYLELQRGDYDWNLLLEGDTLLAGTGNHVGLAVEQANAAIYLEALYHQAVAEQASPTTIQLIAEDDDALHTLNGLLPDSINNNDAITIHSDEGCYWNLTEPAAPSPLNFRTGRLARKMPFNKWWSEWRAPAIACAASFLVVLCVTWFAQHQLTKQQKRIVAQTDDIYRQAVPSGSITNPERQLKAKLGKTGGTVAPSNAVELLSAVAPVIKRQKDVKVRNFRYNADNSQLQMNIEAKSFNTFETLRSKIAEAGYTVEIKRANKTDSAHQAQISVTEEG